MRRRTRRTVWLVGTLLAVTLVVLAVVVTVGRANRQQADDPRSTTRAGAGALGVLLAEEGVSVSTTSGVDDAVADAAPGRALVVANGELLDEADARRLLTAGYGRVVLLRPSPPALVRFGVRAEGRSADAELLTADCPVAAAERAGPILVEDARVSYVATAPAEFACYPTGDGHAYLRVGTDAGPAVELVAGGLGNETLADAGNAAFALNTLGAQAELTWLMARRGDDPEGAAPPSLLPPWWRIAVAQAAVAFLVVAVWRGRRLGPIMVEPLPVTVRAAETVEGHGRLYHRLDAYDRAAAALRAGTFGRLARVFGHAEDPLALSAAVAARTGLDARQVRGLLVDARPATDDALVTLARDLDRLEQEARRL